MTKVSVFLIKQTTCLFSDVTPDRQGDRPRRYSNIDRSVGFYGFTTYCIGHFIIDEGGGGVNMLYLVNEQNLKLKRIFFDISKKGRITNIKKGSWKFS